MPALPTFYLWLHQHKEFLDLYDRAKSDQAECFADEIKDISDEPPRTYINKNGDEVVDSGWVTWQNNRSHNRKWIAQMFKRHKFGDKVEHSGQVSFTPAQFELPKPKESEVLTTQEMEID